MLRFLVMITHETLESMTPEERTRYEELLRLEVAKKSPLDLACLMYPETERWPQLELLNEYLLALCEYRLTTEGPIPATQVQWWYEELGSVRSADGTYPQVLVGAPGDIPKEVRAFGAFDQLSGSPIVFDLAVSMMPRAGKSRLITEVFPLWLMLHDPDLQIGLATYNDTFAGDWGEGLKMTTMGHHSTYEEEGRTPFLPYPEGGMRAAKDIFKVRGTKGKIRYTGTGGAVTGKTLNVLIADDLIKNEDDVLSDATREGVHRFIDTTWRTRRTRVFRPGAFMPFPVEVRMATRWHRMDPIGYSCFDHETNEQIPSWCVLNIPALCVDEESDPLGRKLGESHPNAAGLTEGDLEALRIAKPREFSALYLGNPVVDGGGLISTDFRTYSMSPDGDHIMWRGLSESAEEGDVPEMMSVPLSECIVFATADMAATKKTSADYTVLGVIAYSREFDMAFILDWYRKRITTDQYNEELVPIIQDHNCSMTVVENVTYGQVFGQGLERKKLPVEMADAMQDKVARVLSSKISNRIRRGALRVPRTAPYLSLLVSEVGLFPNDDHDDQVDVLAFAGIYLEDMPDYFAPREPRVKSTMDLIDDHADSAHRNAGGRGRGGQGRKQGYRRRGGWSRI